MGNNSEFILSEITRDAITELLNMAIGRSAGALNEMIGEEVSLSVPRIDILSAEEATDLLNSQIGSDMSLVKQKFSGPIAGNAYLVFPEDNSLQLVHLLLGEDVLLEDIPDLEQEALIEVGNVLLNAFLGCLGNEFGVVISSDIPTFTKQASSEGVTGITQESESMILFVHVDFNLRKRNIRSYLVLVVSIPTMTKFTNLVDQYIARAM